MFNFKKGVYFDMYNSFKLKETNNIFQDMLLSSYINTNERFFYQLIGIPENKQEYMNELFIFNKKLESNKNYVKFEDGIPLNNISQLVLEIRNAFKFKDLTQKDFIFDKCFNFSKNFGDKEKKKFIKKNFISICNKWYNDTNKLKTVTFDMVVNFGVKFGTWLNSFYEKLFLVNENIIPKVLFYGDIKEHEIYFLQFLFNCGCDILYVNTEKNDYLKLDKISIKKMFEQQELLPPFPKEEVIIPHETNGLKAQKEVEDMYYSNSDLLKPHQLQKHKLETVPLKFSYEELFSLWNTDGNIRPRI